METGPYSFQAPESDGEYRRSDSSSSDVPASSALSMGSALSSSSSCGRMSPPTSFSGLRRSTFDLSDYQKMQQPEGLRYRGGRSLSNSTASTCSSSSSPIRTICSAHAGAATRALLEMTVHDALSPTMRTRSSSQELKSHGSSASFSCQYKQTGRSPSSSSLSSNDDRNNCKDIGTNNDDGHRRGNESSPRFVRDLESLAEDLMLGYLTFLHIFIIAERHVRGSFQMLFDMVSSLLNAIQFEEPIDRSHMDDTDSIVDDSVMGTQKDLKQETTESCNQQDDQPPSTDSTATQRSDAVRDEWGHFADFQDELADESSFIPSCRVSLNPVARRSSHNKSSLQTLTEIAEDDNVDDDDMEEEDH